MSSSDNIEARTGRVLSEQVTRGVTTQVVATGIHAVFMQIVREELAKVAQADKETEDDKHE